MEGFPGCSCSLSFSGAVPTAIARVGWRHGSRSLELEFRLLNLSGSSDSGQAHSASFFFFFFCIFTVANLNAGFHWEQRRPAHDGSEATGITCLAVHRQWFSPSI